jgi:thiol-disulfide isomerase/thioredoxin
MNIFVSRAAALILAIGLASLGVATDSPPPTDSRKSLVMLGIGDDYQVQYKDETGRAISESAFFDLVHQGRSFEKVSNPAKHVAVLSVNAKGSASPHAPTHPIRNLQVGDIFPPLAGALNTGTKVTASTFKNRFTLVNFFFVTCGPCIAESPVLSQFQKDRPEVRTLAITFDDPQDALKFSKQWHFSWPILADQQDYVDRIGVTAYPLLVLVAPDGRIRDIAMSTEITNGPLTTEALAQWVTAREN